MFKSNNFNILQFNNISDIFNMKICVSTEMKL